MVKKQTSDDRSRYAHMSKEERLQSFKRTIAHPHLKAADQELREAIRETGGASIVNVFGPARVGKTTIDFFPNKGKNTMSSFLPLSV